MIMALSKQRKLIFQLHQSIEKRIPQTWRGCIFQFVRIASAIKIFFVDNSNLSHHVTSVGAASSVHQVNSEFHKTLL